MQVFILEYYTYHEPSVIQGVFDSKEKAEKYLKEHPYNKDFDTFEITEFTLM